MHAPDTSVNEDAPDINAAIAARVRDLRTQRGLSIEALAEASGVSRSMISLIERGETSATAVLLEKLSGALGTTLAGLFETGDLKPLSRRADQRQWRDPAAGYTRRNVSPAGTPVQVVEVEFPPGAHVAYETGAFEAGRRRQQIHHRVWVLSGEIEVTVGAVTHSLARGDCLAFTLDGPTAYRNPRTKPARYAVIIAEGVRST